MKVNKTEQLLQIVQGHPWNEEILEEQQNDAQKSLFDFYNLLEHTHSQKNVIYKLRRYQYLTYLFFIKTALEQRNYWMTCHEIETLMYNTNICEAGVKANLLHILETEANLNNVQK